MKNARVERFTYSGKTPANRWRRFKLEGASRVDPRSLYFGKMLVDYCFRGIKPENARVTIIIESLDEV